MKPSIGSIIKSHSCFTCGSDLQCIANPLKSFGIEYFSYVSLNSSQEIIFNATNPTFAEHYLRSGYFNNDAFHQPLLMQETLMIWDYHLRTALSEAMHNDFARHGYGHSFSILLKDTNNTHCYTFATHIGNTDINTKYIEYLPYLKQFIIDFHNHIHYSSSLSTMFDLSIQCHQGNYSRIDDNSVYVNHINGIVFPTTRQHLTIRQIECLYCLSHGKTIEDVAIIMKISPRTVKAHIKLIKEKLHCHTQFQLGVVFHTIQTLYPDIIAMIKK